MTLLKSLNATAYFYAYDTVTSEATKTSILLNCMNDLVPVTTNQSDWYNCYSYYAAIFTYVKINNLKCQNTYDMISILQKTWAIVYAKQSLYKPEVYILLSEYYRKLYDECQDVLQKYKEK